MANLLLSVHDLLLLLVICKRHTGERFRPIWSCDMQLSRPIVLHGHIPVHHKTINNILSSTTRGHKATNGDKVRLSIFPGTCMLLDLFHVLHFPFGIGIDGGSVLWSGDIASVL